MTFRNRRDAGRRLSERLRELALTDPVVLALPRGGVPVAYEVALALDAPLDVIVARKIGAPMQPELGVGALAEGGVTIFDERTLQLLGLTAGDVASTIERETAELHRRVRLYRGDRPPVDVEGRSVLVIDDGLATGVSARAALRSVRARNPGRLILAVPVGPGDAEQLIAPDADNVVVLQSPARLTAVGQWYDDFTQTPDENVLALLSAAAERGQPGRHD